MNKSICKNRIQLIRQFFILSLFSLFAAYSYSAEGKISHVLDPLLFWKKKKQEIKSDKYVYSQKELFKPYEPRVYKGEGLSEIAFPLGGIGTGSISLGGRGELIDWEIFNKPNKGYRPKHTFFSIWMKQPGERPVFKILESRLPSTYNRNLSRSNFGGAYPAYDYTAGLSRFRETEFIGEYPFATVNYKDEAVPLQIQMTCFNPFIPLNDKDSSLPVVIFLFHLKNPAKSDILATLAFNMENMIGGKSAGKCLNKVVKTDEYIGIDMKNGKLDENALLYGNIFFGTSWNDVTFQCPWLRRGWFDRLHHFCNTFVETGEFENNASEEASQEGATDIASLGMKIHLAPGEEKTIPFILAWYIPWFELYWKDGPPSSAIPAEKYRWKNYYATLFKNAEEVFRYTEKNRDRLCDSTLRFKNALFNSTLPECVIDAIAANISILKTTTCLRLEDGSFYGFEGCHGDSGCCSGTCTHVWNYAQALPYLFPKLERSLRTNEFQNSVGDTDGHMQFRMELPLGTKADHGFHAAADGQMGGILKLYREWMISGDDRWMKELWPSVQKTLEYSWVLWDKDKDGIIEGMHHNTYDIEFYGSEPLANTFYLGALSAARKIADYVGDKDKALEYEKIFRSGSEKMDEKYFNGEYYFQDLPDVDQYKYQYGKGCLSDQLIGQWYADMLNLEPLMNRENIRKALKSIFQYNWMTSFENFNNPQRVYAMNKDKGLLLCSWPGGGRPKFPFVYSDEVWYGIEYQAASCMIYNGLLEEGLSIVKGARERNRGFNRNPWNEVECGNHYARSMSSYSLLPALSGFSYSGIEKTIQFAPKVNREKFKVFFSVDSGWGAFELEKTKKGYNAVLKVEEGSLVLKEIRLGEVGDKERIICEIAGEDMKTEKQMINNILNIKFHQQGIIKPNSPLTIQLR